MIRTVRVFTVLVLASHISIAAQQTAPAKPQTGRPAGPAQQSTAAGTTAPMLPQFTGTVSVGRVTSVRPHANGMEVQAGPIVMRITAMHEGVIRVRAQREGRFMPDHSWAVVPEAALAALNVRMQDSPQAAEFATPQLRVRVHKADGRIAFLDPQGKVISEDAAGRPATWTGNSFTIWKTMPEMEQYFGLGDKAGPLDRRNLAFTNWNTDAFGWQESTDPLYKSIPFYIGYDKDRAYGIFLDNSWRTFFDFGKQSREALAFGADDGELNYYFIAGPHPKQVIERYTWLTGRMELPPLYALGFQQCRYSYFPEARVREIAATFRQKQIPVDVIYLDIDYQDKNKPFTVNRELFPNFEGMIRDLHAQNIKVIAITDLHLAKEPGYKPYDEGLKGDHFVKNPDGSVYVGKVWPGDSVFPDFTLARSREWWGTLYADFVRMGIDGFWNDMNEPAIFERADKTMPLETRHRLDDGRVATHREIHNVFGMQNVRATHDGMLRLRPEVRPFVLTRAAYAGTQRWAASWTGDNTSSWNHMRLSVPTLLNLGLSGYTNNGVDIGGFWGSPDPDLLTRWHQLGAFNPIFRNHTVKESRDQEPWVHGPEHERIRKRYIELRYELMPYTYTLAEEASRTGIPIMRPIFLEYPGWREATENHQFLYGRDLLIAPKVWEQLPEYHVTLPKGLWYDYWTGERKPGGEGPILVAPKLHEMPVYVRGGAIIPHQPVVQSTSEKPNGPLELRVYPGPECSGTLYHDDGLSFRYRQGEYLRQSFTCEVTDRNVTVRVAKSEGTYRPWWTQVQLTIYGAAQAPARVTADGQPVESRHNAQAGTVTLVVTPQAKEVRVEY